MLCVQNTDTQNTDNSHRLVVSTEIILCVQDRDNSHRHVVCAEHRQFQRSRCVCRTQTILTVMLRVQNTDRQNTDNSHRLVVSIENRQFSPSGCVCRTQTNWTQTILTVMCAQNTNGTETILTVMLCVQHTDKQNTDNYHCHVCAEHKRDNFQCHVVCAEHRQTEQRQLSPSSCVCRIQTEHKQFSLSFCLCRTQTILTVKLCVQNTDKQNTDNSHCHFVRAEHSWAVVWTRPSAVPTTPCGNCSSRTERGTSTVCDTAACWSVGTDPSRLVWHQDGQRLTQWGTAHQTPTADRSKRAKLLTSPSSFISLHCSVWLSFFFVLSVLPSSFLSFCTPCLVFFFSVFFVLSVLSFSFLFLCSLCLVFFLPVSLFSLSCLFPSGFLCSLCRAFLLAVFFVLAISPFSFLCLFSLSCRLLFCLLSFPFRRVLYSRGLSWLEQCSKARYDLYVIHNYKGIHSTSETHTKKS